MIQESSTLTVTTAIVGGVALVVGAACTAAAAAFAARLKIREVELTYQQRLKDTYLGNARQYITNVYIPITIALGLLSDAYVELRKSIDSEERTAPEEAVAIFKTACDAYLRTIDDLFARGADAFLTSATETRLRSLGAFIRDSRTAIEARTKAVFQYRVSMFPMSGLFGGSPNIQSVSKLLTGKSAVHAVRLRSFSLDVLGFGIGFEAAELLAAPLLSHDFEERIVSDIANIKFLIKEVTLGSQSETR